MRIYPHRAHANGNSTEILRIFRVRLPQNSLRYSFLSIAASAGRTQENPVDESVILF